MPTISVIVPVYKVEAYLDRCVESILAQTFKDFELILVDDGSPDNCPAMCDAWAEKDSRIKVIHKENGGLSDARNVGFEASCGEWISFIDSDDYVHANMLQALYNAVQAHGVKVSTCGFAATAGEPLEDNPDLTANLWSAEDFYVQRNVNATVAWGKLYHRSVVLPYPKGKLHEDEFVTYRILFACENIAVLDAPLYGYYQNPTGIMGSTWNPKRLDRLEAIQKQIAFFKESGYTHIYKRAIHFFLTDISIHVRAIDNLSPSDTYIAIKKQLIKLGKKHFRKYQHKNVFDWYTDGYILYPIFPRRVKWHGFLHAIYLKLKG